MDHKMKEIITAAQLAGVEVDEETVELLQNPNKLDTYVAVDDLFENLTAQRPISNIQRSTIRDTIGDIFAECEEDEDRSLVDRNRATIEELAMEQMYDNSSDYSRGIIYAATEAATGIMPEAYGRIYPWSLAPDEYDDLESDDIEDSIGNDADEVEDDDE